MKKNLLYAWFVIGLLILSACALRSVESEMPLPTEELPEPTEVLAESVFGPGTFSFELPSGWDIFGPEIITDESNRSYQLYLLGEDPTNNDGPGISKVIIANADHWTPEELALIQCSTCLPNEFEPVMVGGKPGVRTQIGGGGVPFEVTWYYIENQGNLIGFALHDPQTLAPLDQVIESIIFE